jgi:hypothetical protein
MLSPYRGLSEASPPPLNRQDHQAATPSRPNPRKDRTTHRRSPVPSLSFVGWVSVVRDAQPTVFWWVAPTASADPPYPDRLESLDTRSFVPSTGRRNSGRSGSGKPVLIRVLTRYSLTTVCRTSPYPCVRLFATGECPIRTSHQSQVTPCRRNTPPSQRRSRMMVSERGSPLIVMGWSSGSSKSAAVSGS